MSDKVRVTGKAAQDTIRIVHVIVGLNVGGAELMLKRLILSQLNTDRYQHSVISLTGVGEIGRDLRAEGIEVCALNMINAKNVFRAFFDLRKKLDLIRPDIVQTWMYHADLIGGLAAYSVGLRKIIWGIRTTDVKAGGGRVTRGVRKACAVLSYFIPTKIVCAANASRDVHVQVGYNKSKMIIIPNGFDVERLIKDSRSKDKLRTGLGYTSDDIVIGSVGRFNAVKDQKSFIQAAGILAKSHSNVRYLMVGRDIDTDNLALKGWIEETGFPEYFLLLGQRQDVPACLAAMDIFCLHSRTEGFPNVVGEAMVLGKPCVVTDVGDAAYLVQNSGIVVARDNPPELADGLAQMLKLSKSDLDLLGVLGRKRIQSQFTMVHTAHLFETLYDQIM
ncbi:glycosyltransferase family 4 protein [Halopseudomonas pelagia]|uniref:glycosyltransferase family 4 protein n=1 Tax=Halopseudomonas pelagia TaxID=553151 RepID=UPI00039CE898|nr:glycosyltransferase [Halopseudomonas pelagia]